MPSKKKILLVSILIIIGAIIYTLEAVLGSELLNK